ncbi:PAS domain-containing protein [Trichothermofontia sp.]
MQAQLQQIISPHYHLTTMSDHHRALQLIQAHHPSLMSLDLIIINLSLARFKQFVWIQDLRSTESKAIIPLLLLATEAEADLSVLDMGADNYIIESISRVEYLTQIKGILNLNKKYKNLQISANSDHFLIMLLKRLPEAVIAINLDYRITYLNTRAENLYGVQANSIMGHPLTALYQCHWLQPEDEAIAIRSLASIGEWHGENKHLCRDGQMLHIATSLTVLRNKEKEPIGLLFVLRDITQLKRIELALKESELHLSHISDRATLR